MSNNGLRPNEADARRTIEAAIARRQEVFTVSHYARGDHGYTIKFRQGIADLVWTVDEGTFQELAKMETLLDKVRSSFLSLRP